MNRAYKPELTQFLVFSKAKKTLHTYTTESFGGYGVIEDFILRNHHPFLLIGERKVDSGKGFILRRFSYGRKYVEENFNLYRGRYAAVKDQILYDE